MRTVERGKAAVRKLQEQGIVDSHGRRIRIDLPADMQEGKDRDFVRLLNADDRASELNDR